MRAGRRGRGADADRDAPPVWLRSVTVEGFRGIGAAGDAGARAGARADGRRRPQRQRQVVVRRGARAADDRRAEALGEAPEGVDGDLAVPAPRRPDAARRASCCSRAARTVALAQEWPHGAAYDDASGRAQPATRWRARLGPRPAVVPAVPRLRRAGDDVRHAVLALRRADAGARARRHRRAGSAARRRAAGLDNQRKDVDAARERAGRAAGPRRRARRAGRRARSAPRKPDLDAIDAAARGRARLQRRHRAAAPARRARAADRRGDREAFKALRVAERAHEDAAQDRRDARDRRSPRCCGRRSRCATPRS